ncbi:MAG: GTP-binding protein, partial [Chloroflexi bacterium]|nr:GTP-binding protein [Chloroflexota bacterium]
MLPDSMGRLLSEVARLDTTVTVVDAAHWLHDFQSEDELAARDPGAPTDDVRPLADLLVEQVEFADVIVLNKIDMVGADDLARLETLLRRLNPDADLVRTEYGRVPLEQVLNTGKFNFEQETSIAGWIVPPGEHRHDHDHDHGGHAHHGEAYGISSFVFRARKPFHPQRLSDFIQSDLFDPVLRSKGSVWIASRPEDAVLWSQAGDTLQFDLIGTWWADTPRDDWPDDADELDEIEAMWDDSTGDRRQELVFIGLHMVHDPLLAALTDCLLTDEELAAGPEAWRTYDDPFPAWDDLYTDDDLLFLDINA